MASTRSPIVTGQSERRLSDPMVILFSVRERYVPKEAEPCLVNKAGNWMLVGCLLSVALVMVWSRQNRCNRRQRQWRRQGGREGSFPQWVDVQKLCNMCVLSLS